MSAMKAYLYGQACEWFRLCANVATGTQSHPILGDVPICDRCQALYDKMS